MPAKCATQVHSQASGTRSIRRSNLASKTVLSMHRPLNIKAHHQNVTAGSRHAFLHGASKLHKVLHNGSSATKGLQRGPSMALQRGASMALESQMALRRAHSMARAPSGGLGVNLGGFLNRQGSAGLKRQPSNGKCLLKRASSTRTPVSRRFALALQTAAIATGGDLMAAVAPTKILQQMVVKPHDGIPGAGSLWLDKICDKAIDKLEDKVEDHLSNVIDAAVEEADNMAVQTFLNIVTEGFERQDKAKELLSRGELIWHPKHA